MLHLDADLANADWTKQTWDLSAKNIGELRAWLTSRGMSVAAFKRLPVYRLNVTKLAWLQDL